MGWNVTAIYCCNLSHSRRREDCAINSNQTRCCCMTSRPSYETFTRNTHTQDVIIGRIGLLTKTHGVILSSLWKNVQSLWLPRWLCTEVLCGMVFLQPLNAGHMSVVKIFLNFYLFVYLPQTAQVHTDRSTDEQGQKTSSASLAKYSKRNTGESYLHLANCLSVDRLTRYYQTYCHNA